MQGVSLSELESVSSFADEVLEQVSSLKLPGEVVSGLLLVEPKFALRFIYDRCPVMIGFSIPASFSTLIKLSDGSVLGEFESVIFVLLGVVGFLERLEVGEESSGGLMTDTPALDEDGIGADITTELGEKSSVAIESGD
jgi:hypothetical protein